MPFRSAASIKKNLKPTLIIKKYFNKNQIEIFFCSDFTIKPIICDKMVIYKNK